MNERRVPPVIIVPILLICLIALYLSQQRHFNYTVNSYGISFRVPTDFELTMTDANILAYPVGYVQNSYDQGILYGHDGKGIYYRVMWNREEYLYGMSEKQLLDFYVQLESNGERTIFPIQNTIVQVENGSYEQLSTQTNWPYISGVHHKLLSYEKVFQGMDGHKIYSWTTIWYCPESKRQIIASLESENERYVNYNWGFFVAYINCNSSQ